MAELDNATDARNHAATTVECEGLAYAVQDYCDPETYEADPLLEELWRDAAIACSRLETYLALNAGDSDELMDRTADLKRLGVSDRQIKELKGE